MNRNNNMTGNFGTMHSKNLKPGDSALIGMKSGTQTLKMNNVSNNTNTNKFHKYDEMQLNEAKESMKLLQTKIGNNLGNNNFGGASKNTANNLNSNNLNNNANSNNNHYRKPFKPTFENENAPILMDSHKNFSGASGINKMNSKNQLGGGVNPSSYKNTANRISYTSNTTRNFSENNNMGKKATPNQMSKNNNVNNYQYDAPNDDRPAFTNTYVRFDKVDAEDNDEDDGDRLPCQTCGRKFREEALLKHQKVCKKVFASKRKTFDMKKKRLDGEAAALLKLKEMEEKKKGKFGNNNNNNNKNKGNNPKWKKQSEEFRAILKANRTVTTMPRGGANGKSKPGTGYNNKMGSGNNILPMTMPTSSVLYEDYIQCSHCNRKYNEQAYNKHLPTCERRAKEAVMKDKMKSGGQPQGINYANKPNLNVRFGKR